jgi:hypothetical protein
MSDNSPSHKYAPFLRHGHEQKAQPYDMGIYQQQLHQSGANLIQFNVVKGPKGWQGENVQPL